jgi:putative transposase
VKELDPVALFRLSVLGPLISRQSLAPGELQAILRQLSQKTYSIPGSNRQYVALKTLQTWYYNFRHEGLDGLAPKQRTDHGLSKISAAAQESLLAAKRENPRRSLKMLQHLLERSGEVPRGTVSRSAIHRLLKRHGLSRPTGAASEPQERRSFCAEHAGQIWYGDVMHGPHALVRGRSRKTYLVSLMDDASRLIVHSAFCLAEGALQIEGVLKQAVLKRGLCSKLVVDNGPAYCAKTMHAICARLGIQLIHCRPYSPESKGKLERYHRTLRAAFLSELTTTAIELDDLNARLWAWLEEIHHKTPHAGLLGQTPLSRYQQDLPHIRTLGSRAAQLDAIFQHRVQRHVRKDGTVSYWGRRFEVPYELAGKTTWLIVDPHTHTVIGVEDDEGKPLGATTPLDMLANRHRTRHKPASLNAPSPMAKPSKKRKPTLIDLAYAQHYGPIAHDDGDESDTEVHHVS